MQYREGKKKHLKLAILIFLLLISQAFVTIYSAKGEIIFTPIIINGDAEFAEMAKLMNWSGNGSADNPYVIENLTIQPPLGMNGIYISNTSVYFTIRKLKVIYASNPKECVRAAGLYLSHVANAIIENSVFESNKVGVYLYNSSSIVVRNSLFVKNSEGLRSEDCENVKIEDNIFYGDEIGIFLLQSGDANITGNYLEKNDVSIGVRECEKITIYMNDVYGHWDTGIGIVKSTDIHILRNNVSVEKGRVWEERCGYGISAYSSNFVVIENNSIDGNYSQVYGMGFDESENLTVEGNIVEKNAFDGLEIFCRAKNILIEKNKISFNRYNGVKLVNSKGIVLRRNEITYNYRPVYPSGYWGIGIHVDESSENLIVENLIAFNGLGIRIVRGNSSRIYNNTFFYNALSGDRYNKYHIQAQAIDSHNYWNSSSGCGNYWADWVRNNDTNDRDGDGIVDWPYKLGEGSERDYFPLKKTPVFWAVEPPSPRNLKIRYEVGYVNITWLRPLGNGTSPIIGYRIYRDNESIATLPAGRLYYNDTSVINGVKYEYYVTAFNSDGESLKSNVVTGVPGIPGRPVNLTANSGDGYVNITWKPPVDNGASEIEYYKIYRARATVLYPGSSYWWELIAKVPVTQLYYNDTNVTNGESYLYSVSAVNTQGEGPRSEDVSVVPGIVPSPPLNLTIAYGEGYVNLTWEKPLNCGGGRIWEYRIYCNGKLMAKVYPASGGLLYYNYTPLTSGAYVYYVTAVNAIGESEPSNEVKIMYGGSSTEIPSQKDIMVPLLIWGTSTIILILIIIIFRKIWKKRR